MDTHKSKEEQVNESPYTFLSKIPWKVYGKSITAFKECMTPKGDFSGHAEIAKFGNAADAIYAAKAVNLHERLVEMLRSQAFAATDQNQSNRCIQCGALGSVGKPRHNEACELAALLNDVEDTNTKEPK